jgi:hypothetical protein
MVDSKKRAGLTRREALILSSTDLAAQRSEDQSDDDLGQRVSHGG